MGRAEQERRERGLCGGVLSHAPFEAVAGGAGTQVPRRWGDEPCRFFNFRDADARSLLSAPAVALSESATT
jgi:hypothetical protein